MEATENDQRGIELQRALAQRSDMMLQDDFIVTPQPINVNEFLQGGETA